MKTAVRLQQAIEDIEAAIDYYQSVSDSDILANRFIDALEHATHHIERRPGTGSPRYANTLNLSGLRCWPLSRFPYALFYLEHPTHLAVLRVLHTQSDIPASLRSDLST
jgi:toxin ParE1/3/4